jgi:hypothetical protein
MLEEDEAYRGIFSFYFDVAIEIVDVHPHLAQILMGELADFQINECVAALRAVVEDKVEKVICAEGKAFLAGLEEEAFDEFQQEGFQRTNDHAFQVTFRVTHPFFQSQKLQNEGVSDQLARRFRAVALLGQVMRFVLVRTESQAFIQAGIDLAFQGVRIPILSGGFNFVK